MIFGQQNSSVEALINQSTRRWRIEVIDHCFSSTEAELIESGLGLRSTMVVAASNARTDDEGDLQASFGGRQGCYSIGIHELGTMESKEPDLVQPDRMPNESDTEHLKGA
ncbi:hypothetical protein SO802_008186 [Lithocarpus litseifolius]|uniref:Uncharacterized protein n=1 Tax=Lithocarpus litseifolius TaxID=425828 RepID=A0AAW2DAQ6_9ROSI